jgi:2-haloacid dehalogenase/putative hydrolase of the HAD superfamily
MTRYEWITFDCYGTLVDWEDGISRAFAEAAAADGLQLERGDVLRAHAEIEPQVQAEHYRSYRTVLGQAAVLMAERLGWQLPLERSTFLASSLTEWKVFDDTNAALEKLVAAGYRLGILSNVDDALLEGTRRQFHVPFDLLVTAEQVRSYKPAHAHFLAARETIGDAPWLHAAQSWFHDIEPVHTLGIPSAWVNRKLEPRRGDARPDLEVRDMRELARKLT